MVLHTVLLFLLLSVKHSFVVGYDNTSDPNQNDHYQPDDHTHTDDPNQQPVPIHYLNTSDSSGWKVLHYSSANPTIRICLGLEIEITKEQTTGHPLKIVEGYQNWHDASSATANISMGTSEVSTAITLTPTSNITYTYICTNHQDMIGYIEVNSEYCQVNHDNVHDQSQCLNISDFQSCNTEPGCTYVLHKFDEPQTCECVSINDSCFGETESEGADCVSQTSLPTNCTSNNDQHNHINDDINNDPPPVSCNTYTGCTGDFRLKLNATCLSEGCNDATCCEDRMRCDRYQYNVGCENNNKVWNSDKANDFCDASGCTADRCCDTSATCADWSGTCPTYKIANDNSTSCVGNADICSETKCCRTPSNCGNIAHNETVTRYQASTVPYGQLCASETRTCDDGALSGSYTFESCTVESAPAQTVTDITFNNEVKTYTICSGESASVTWGGNHNICELSDQTAFNSPPSSNQNCSNGTQRHAFENADTVKTLSNLGAAPGQTRYFICSRHPDAKFKVTCHVPSFDILLQYLRDAFNTFNDCSASSDFPHQIYVKASGDSVFVSYTNSSGHVFSAQKYTDNNVETLDKNIGTGAPADAKYKLDSDYYKEDFEKTP